MSKFTILFLIVSVGLITYSNSLGGGFVWDDRAFVVHNDFIKDLDLLPKYFTSSASLAKGELGGVNYRPFLTLSYAIDYFFWKLNPFGYHFRVHYRILLLVAVRRNKPSVALLQRFH